MCFLVYLHLISCLIFTIHIIQFKNILYSLGATCKTGAFCLRILVSIHCGATLLLDRFTPADSAPFAPACLQQLRFNFACTTVCTYAFCFYSKFVIHLLLNSFRRQIRLLFTVDTLIYVGILLTYFAYCNLGVLFSDGFLTNTFNTLFLFATIRNIYFLQLCFRFCSIIKNG